MQITMEERTFSYYGADYTIRRNGEEAEKPFTITKKRYVRRNGKDMVGISHLHSDRTEYWEYATKECLAPLVNSKDSKRINTVLKRHREAQIHLRLLFAIRRPSEELHEINEVLR